MNSISYTVKNKEDLEDIYKEVLYTFRSWSCKPSLPQLEGHSLIFNIKSKRMFITRISNIKDNIETKCKNKFISTIKKHL